MEHGRAMSTDEQKARLYGPLVGGLLIIAVLAVIVTSFLVREFDLTARSREQMMVEHGLERRIQELEAGVVPQTNWDDAVQNLDRAFDPAWADQNIASYLSTIAGVRDAFVLGRDDRLIYASASGARSDAVGFARYAPVVLQLLPSVREKERRRPPLRFKPGAKDMISVPIQASTLARVNDVPSVITVTLVQPDFGTVMPTGNRAPVVVTVVPLDRPFLVQFAERYLLEGISVVDKGMRDHGAAMIALKGADGAEIAKLRWTPQKPGTLLVRKLMLPFGLLGIIVMTVGVILVRRSSRIASDLIASEARSKHMAFHDALTQLPNRAYMFDRLRQMLALSRRHATTTAVHCLDLDRFKEVNDSLGHTAGDELIRSVARRLGLVCRETDMVARLGGDEFVILQPLSDAAGASHLTRRVLDAFKDPFDLEFGQVQIGCSIGVTLIDNGDIEAIEALRQADVALYRAKEGGRNQASFFESDMDAVLRMRRSLEVDLREALASGDLTMAYQPQMDHHDRISGVEALVRWTHPERGPISPAVFVPLAEESGLILDLGEFVLRRVFDETRDWKAIKVAINASAVQLRSSAFVPMMTRLMREYAVDPACYEIEITETALLGDEALTIDNINFLKNAGFSIALDDFGTGYSSLSSLQRYAVDKIKIDRSFVSNLEVSDEAEALVDAIVKLARALRLNIIAEGVETIEQRDRLAACGCHDIQGYLVSKPVPAGEIESRIDTGSSVSRKRKRVAAAAGAVR